MESALRAILRPSDELQHMYALGGGDQMNVSFATYEKHRGPNYERVPFYQGP